MELQYWQHVLGTISFQRLVLEMVTRAARDGQVSGTPRRHKPKRRQGQHRVHGQYPNIPKKLKTLGPRETCGHCLPRIGKRPWQNIAAA